MDLQKSGVLPLTAFFFENLISVKEPVINISFNVRATKMSIFTFFVNT